MRFYNSNVNNNNYNFYKKSNYIQQNTYQNPYQITYQNAINSNNQLNFNYYNYNSNNLLFFT